MLKVGCTWDDFFIDYNLPSFMEISFIWINRCKIYFIHVGEFEEYKFIVAEQIKGFFLAEVSFFVNEKPTESISKVTLLSFSVANFTLTRTGNRNR
jgi:hypothetical protein